MARILRLALSLIAIAIGALFILGRINAVSAYPTGYEADCSACHGTAGVFPNPVSATPSASMVAPGDAYAVTIKMSPAINGATGTGYWIANSDAAGTTGTSTGVFGGGQNAGGLSGEWTATLTAPKVPGVYYYKVFGQSGKIADGGFSGSTTYNIEVLLDAPRSSLKPDNATPAPVLLSCGGSCHGPRPPTNLPMPPPGWKPPVPAGPTPPATPGIPGTPGLPVTPGITIPVPSVPGPGTTLFTTYCNSCHATAASMGGTLLGRPTMPITEAISAFPVMGYLQSILKPADIQNLNNYIKSGGLTTMSLAAVPNPAAGGGPGDDDGLNPEPKDDIDEDDPDHNTNPSVDTDDDEDKNEDLDQDKDDSKESDRERDKTKDKKEGDSPRPTKVGTRPEEPKHAKPPANHDDGDKDDDDARLTGGEMSKAKEPSENPRYKRNQRERD